MKPNRGKLLVKKEEAKESKFYVPSSKAMAFIVERVGFPAVYSGVEIPSIFQAGDRVIIREFNSGDSIMIDGQEMYIVEEELIEGIL